MKLIFDLVFAAAAILGALQTAPSSDRTPVELASSESLANALPTSLHRIARNYRHHSKILEVGARLSFAEARYSSDEGDAPKTVSINVVDYAGMAGWAEGLAMWEKMDMDQEGDEGFTKTDTINGHKVMMTYQTNDKRGTIQLLINKRLLVNIEAHNVSGDELKAMAKEFDPAKLAAAAPEAK